VTRPRVTPSLEDFEGSWQVDRVIHDHRAGATGRFEGTARFTRTGAGLLYFETGTLTLPGQPPFHAERRYRWHRGDAGIVVSFDDGRFFHVIDPATPDARHWCDPDTYDVTYDFGLWPDWQSVWTVSGPRKAYQMTTFYRTQHLSAT
jgi:hypothetical protein